jgi:hypothetical protein
MNELVQLVMQKTGVSQDTAQKVVDTVTGYLKTKMPPAFASHLDGVLSGESLSEAEGIAEKAKHFVADLSERLGKKSA